MTTELMNKIIFSEKYYHKIKVSEDVKILICPMIFEEELYGTHIRLFKRGKQIYRKIIEMNLNSDKEIEETFLVVKKEFKKMYKLIRN